jgi:hypothetical protein
MLIRALRDGEVPTAPSLAKESERRIRSWLKKKDLSPQLRSALEEQEKLAASRAEDQAAQGQEFEEAVTKSEKAEADGTPGVYVYTLPHYLLHRVDEGTGKTLLKVGHSSTDAYYRAGSAGRLTALPEDPILLRIYPSVASAAVEKQFHSWLRDADHAAGRTQRAGKEWFVTSTRFLDRVATSLGLEVREKRPAGAVAAVCKL